MGGWKTAMPKAFDGWNTSIPKASNGWTNPAALTGMASQFGLGWGEEDFSSKTFTDSSKYIKAKESQSNMKPQWILKSVQIVLMVM